MICLQVGDIEKFIVSDFSASAWDQTIRFGLSESCCTDCTHFAPYKWQVKKMLILNKGRQIVQDRFSVCQRNKIYNVLLTIHGIF